MGALSFQHILILGVLALVFFGGKNKISDIMGDFAKGIKSFKKGLSEDDEKAEVRAPDAPVRTLDHQTLAQAEINKVSEAQKVG